jgi:hypothetical protein
MKLTHLNKVEASKISGALALNHQQGCWCYGHGGYYLIVQTSCQNTYNKWRKQLFEKKSLDAKLVSESNLVIATEKFNPLWEKMAEDMWEWYVQYVIQQFKKSECIDE